MRACALALAGVAALAACLPLARGDSCGYNGLDFSSLMGQVFSGTDGTATYEYYLTPCGVLPSSGPTSPCITASPTASACQVKVQGGTGTFINGNWAPNPAWSIYILNGAQVGVTYTLTGALNCFAKPGAPQNYMAVVNYICTSQAGSLAKGLSVVNSDNSCSLTYNFVTDAACPGGSGGGGGDDKKKKKLSGGWVFIIILCVVFPVYVVAGCIYKSKRMGTTGIENCPNIDFWRALPGLVKDGIVFTFRKLRGLCGGGGGGGNTGSYETM